MAAPKTTEDKWWDWLSPLRVPLPDDASGPTTREFFSDLVKRCVLVESLSPLVTPQILFAAIDQFAKVLAIKLLRSPHIETKLTASGVLPNHSRMAVVELEKPQRAEVVVTQLREYMMMIGGMPRPAKAQLAKPVMLLDHPCNRKRVAVNMKIVQQNDQNSNVYFVKRQKYLEQTKAANYLRELQVRDESELHEKQEKSYFDVKEKYNRIKNNLDLRDLRKEYNMPARR